MKFLLWALIIAAVVLWVLHTRKADRRTGSHRDGGEMPNAETMVRCAHCQIYLPQSDAVLGAPGKFYCSDAHRKSDV